MTLTSSNYHTPEANTAFWSVSLFKAFDKCEAAGLASARGEYVRDESDAILMGKYVDAYFSGQSEEFFKQYGDVMYKRDGSLYAKYERCNTMIDAVERQPKMLEFLKGEKQKIFTAELFGVPWKVKLDVLGDDRIVDFKTIKDFAPVYKEGFGRLSWVEYWGYDIQGAIYQKVVEMNTGKRLPFYLAAVTKETVPDVGLFEIPQHMLDTALKVVEAKIDRFDLVKMGEIEANRCERCEWCKNTKVLIAPMIYESEVG